LHILYIEDEATILSGIVRHIRTSDAVPLTGITGTSIPEIFANLKTGNNLRDTGVAGRMV
jgi:hypothetical protein